MTRIYRYFTKNNSRRFVDALPHILASYNKTRHSSTGLPPNRVDKTNQERVWLKLFNRPLNRTKSTLKVGDHVRIPKEKRPFRKGYKGGWSEEIFAIKKIHQTSPVTYDLQDLGGEDIEGAFYKEELSSTPLPSVWPIEKILDRKGERYLVQWRGYPSKFNEWVGAEALTAI